MDGYEMDVEVDVDVIVGARLVEKRNVEVEEIQGRQLAILEPTLKIHPAA